MRTIFPCLRFGLLVGIGGAVPSAADIRLGDVVVSAGRDGVVQYDFGKSTTNGFQRTSQLNPPPEILLNALSNYQAQNLDSDGDLISHRFKPKQTHAMLQKTPAPDMLFQASHNHIGGTNCENCDHSQLFKPPHRDDRCIMVHYGTIASGNQVIKDGTKRDQLSNELGEVLCFEMEAAGVMNTFPSLVIRGICDYADSHKNKNWQRFAAQTAAAWSKDFLNVVPSVHSPLMPEAAQMTKSLQKFRISRSSLGPGTASTELVKYEFTAESISDYDSLRTYHEFTRCRCPNTTQWILKHETYLQWRAAENSSCLWLTGKIGSGKTLLTSTVIERLLRDFEDSNGLIIHYFYRHSHKVDLSAIAFLNSCIKQILIHLRLTNRLCPPAVETYIRHHHGLNKSSYYFNEIVENAFTPLVTTIDKIVLVVDGLDECDNKDIQEVLKVVRGFLKEPNRKVFISGRASLDISKSIPGSSCIHISEADATSDISGYIRWKLDEKMLERQIVDDLRVLAEIEAELLENAQQMILWVSLQIEIIWEDCSGDTEIRAALKDLPRDLTETYNRCFKRIHNEKGIYSRGYAAKILPWMLEAVRPLTMTQLREALAIDPSTGIINHGMMPSIQDTMRSCANLIIQNADHQVFLAHHSIYQYLKDRIQIQGHNTAHEFTEDPTMPRLSTAITLARLCIEHLLSKDYNLAVQRLDQGSTLRIELPEISRLTAAIPRPIRPFLPRLKPIQVTLPPVQSKSTKIVTLPDFFHYARDQWAELTRGWNTENDCYPKFASLALNPNETWRLHPWEPLGQSIDSHYFGLLGWSIVNKHESLFRLLVRNPEWSRQEHLYALPFYPYDGLNSVLLAARNDTPWVFDFIPKTALSSLLKFQDRNGWTALHYAVDTRSTDLVTKLVALIQLSPITYNGVSPLEMASAKGYVEIVEILLQISGLSHAEQMLKATTAAIRNGHASLLDGVLNISKAVSAGPRDIKEAILDATAMGYSDVIKAVSTTLSNDSLKQNELWFRWRKGVLSAAIRLGQVKVVDAVIPESSTIPDDDVVGQDFRTFINKVLETNDPVKYQCLVNSWRKLSRTFSSGMIPADLLHEVIQKNAYQQVDMLLKCGIDPCIPFASGTTALEIACATKRHDILKILVNHKAFGDGHAGQLEHAGQLMYAAILIDDLRLAERLLDRGLNPMSGQQHRSGSGKLTSLLMASTTGSDKMLALILKAASKWSHKNDFGYYELQFAATAGCSKKVELLYAYLCRYAGKAYLDRLDYNYWGTAAFFHSCINSHSECAKFLQNYGANPRIPNDKGSTILQAMVKQPNFQQCLSLGFKELIESNQVDINMRNASGVTALHTAILYQNQCAIKILLSLGANINIQDHSGTAPIHLAIKFQSTDGHSRIETLLSLNKGEKASLDIQDKIGNTALHYAVLSNRLDDVKALMTAGARVNIKNNAGDSPIVLSRNFSMTITLGSHSRTQRTSISARQKNKIYKTQLTGSNGKIQTK